MIISEKQIMQLIEFNRHLASIVLVATDSSITANICDQCLRLCHDITNQQSSELKVIE